MMQPASADEKRVALLIDFENIKPSSLKHIVERASIFGMVTVKRAYADWSTRSEAKNILSELGIEAIHHFRATRARKNASDICLTVDAMDLLYRNRADVFVLVTADSDFVRLVRRLREDGKTVVGMGSSGVVSQALISVCDRYLFVEELGVEKEERKELSHAERLVLQAIDNTADEDGFVLGSRLHQAILKLDPSFAYRDPRWCREGQRPFKTFGDFLKSVPSIKMMHDPEKGGLLVGLNDGDLTPGRGSSSFGDMDRMRGRSDRQKAPLPASGDMERPSIPAKTDDRRAKAPRRRGGGYRRRDAVRIKAVPAGSIQGGERPEEGEAAGHSGDVLPAAVTESGRKGASEDEPRDVAGRVRLPENLADLLTVEIDGRGGVLTTQAARSIICRASGVNALKDLGVRSLRELVNVAPSCFDGLILDRGTLRRR